MGMVFDIQRCSVNDGPGLRTTVFFKGCPLRCLWCHNPESQNRFPELMYHFEKCTGCQNCAAVCPCHDFTKGEHHFHREGCTSCGQCVKACPANALEIKGRDYSADDVFQEILKDKPFYDRSEGGVTISGGEPCMQPDFLREILKKCREHQIHTAVETSGFTTKDILQEIVPLTDLFLWDYKATENSLFYIGAKQEVILDNLKFVVDSDTHIRLRCPIIPGVGDHLKHLQVIAEISKQYPLDGVDILPYHNMGVYKSRQLGRTPWDAGLTDLTEEDKERISCMLTACGCKNFRIL